MIKSVWKYYSNTKIIVNWTDGYVVKKKLPDFIVRVLSFIVQLNVTNIYGLSVLY